MRLVEIAGCMSKRPPGPRSCCSGTQDAPHRVLPIFVGRAEATSIALALNGEAPPRPLAHDVMAALVESVDAHVDAVSVTHVRDGAFLAELAISGPGGELRLDTRPSDAIALAVRLGTPLFVSDEVLEEAGTVLTEVPDEETIDEEVAEFRTLLDALDPADLTRIFDAPPSHEAGRRRP